MAGSNVKVSDYVAGRHYVDGNLEFFQHSEGRVTHNSGTFAYEYNLTDHLGNVRVSVDQSGTVVQKDDYYPFGLTFNSWSPSRNGGKNNYQFNGNEVQVEIPNVADFNARFYDASLGRFMNIDPLAEVQESWTPYHFSYNNPIMLNDPSGLLPEETLEDEESEESRLKRLGESMEREHERIFGALLNGEDCPTGDCDTSEKKKGKKKNNEQEPFGFRDESLPTKFYKKRGDFVRMKDLLSEFLSGKGPERSSFSANHLLTKGMKRSVVVKRAREFYAANFPNGGDMIRKHFDFFVTDVPFVNSDIEQFIGSARVSIYSRGDVLCFIVDNTTGRFSGGFDSVDDIPRRQGEPTPTGNIYQRFIWVENK